MGSTRIQVLKAMIAILMLVSFPAQGEERVKSVFSTELEIKAWADSAFWGGHDVITFSKEGVTAVVVIGSHTGGVPSSETYVFSKAKNKQFKLIVTRASVAGLLKAHETAEGIEIRTQKNNVVLFLPWFGIADEFDYFVESSK